MNRSIYRAAIIGCGMIGSHIDETGHPLGIQSHASAFKNCVRTNLIGVSDIDRERASNCARMRSIPFHCVDHLTLLDACRPDIVSVAVPTEVHAAILSDVIGFPSVRLVICEKPLTGTTADASVSIEKAAKMKCHLIVNYSRHFLPIMAKIGEKIAVGQIGEIRAISGYYTKSILHNGTHLLDLLRFWFGELNIETARSTSWAGASNQNINLMMCLSNGASVTLHALNAADYSLFEIDIIGSQGRIRLTDSGNRIAFHKVRNHSLFTGYRELEPCPHVMENCLQDIMHHVVEASCDLLDGVPIPKSRYCSGEEALAILELAEKALRIAGNKK